MLRNILIGSFLFLFFQIKGQHELLLHLHDSIPQVNLTNPGKWSNDKIYVSLPSVSLNYTNSSFSYNDLIKQPENEGESLRLTLDDAIEALAEKNYLFANLNINLLTAGYSNEKNHFGFYLSEKLNASLMYRKTLLELIRFGNEPYLGEELNIAPDVSLLNYREWAFSYGRKINDLTIGARAKYIQGLGNITSNNNELNILTHPEDYRITLSSNLDINTARTEGFEEIISPFSNFGNHGFGMDFGASYKINDNFSISASVLDLGFINWENGVNYSTNQVYEFDGIDAFNFGDSLNFDSYLDSIQQLIDIQENEVSFRSYLQPSTYLAASYLYKEKHRFSVQFFNDYFNSRLVPSITFGYSTKFNKLFNLPIENNLGVYWSLRNQSPYNLGLNYAIRFKNVQIFLSGDNLLSFLFPRYEIPLNQLAPVFKEDSSRTFTIPGNLRNYNFRVGINILF